ncbi:MAG: Fic family protein [Patescibacteria group bacterium]
MFQPKYTISGQILQNISQIEAAKALIDHSPIIPAYEKQFREDAITRTVHYGTKLEGNELSFGEVAKIIEGEKIVAGKRDIQEVINYRQVSNYLEKLIIDPSQKDSLYSNKTLLELHRLVVDKVVPQNQSGVFRKLQVTIRNSATDEVFFRPPPPAEVPFLVGELFGWLNSEAGKQGHPVIRSGVAHYFLVAVHPFTEGNGRTSRAMATLILMAENYNIKGLFSLEEYFDRQAESYYNSLQAVSAQPGDLSQKDQTPWLEFFTLALASELKKVEEKIRNLSSDLQLRKRLGGKQIPLTERQIKLVEYMRQFGGLRISDAQQILPMVSDDTIWRDLKKLIESRIVEKRGSTKGAYYRLAS